jgi:hypothetical protein
MSADVLAPEEDVPTEKERAGRRELLNLALRIRARQPRARGPLPSAEAMQREDRRR